jgi:hypothetical protein
MNPRTILEDLKTTGEEARASGLYDNDDYEEFTNIYQSDFTEYNIANDPNTRNRAIAFLEDTIQQIRTFRQQQTQAVFGFGAAHHVFHQVHQASSTNGTGAGAGTSTDGAEESKDDDGKTWFDAYMPK